MEYSIYSGFETLTPSPRNTEKPKPVVDERMNASPLVTYSGTRESLQVEVIASPYSSLTLMLKDDGSEDVVLRIGDSIRRDASLILTLYKLNAGSAQARVTLDLCEEETFAMLHSAYIAAGRKRFHMQCNHLQVHTEGLMEDYVIVKGDGQYRMEAIGKIIKDVRESNPHQKTKVLTMSEQHNSEVVPMLLVDESDVKASHATTLGQLDENQLYYLQTRGLSRRQTLGLLTVGYIIPVTELFDQEEVHTALKDEVEMRVGLRA